MRTPRPARMHAARSRTTGALALAAAILLGTAACTGAPGGTGGAESSGGGAPRPGSTSSPAPSPAAGSPGAPSSSPGGAAAGGSPSSSASLAPLTPLSPVALTVADGTDPGAASGRSLSVPPGWAAEVWADVSGARSAAWDPDGRLVVSTGSRGVLALLTPTGPGRAPAVSTLLDGLDDPQGVAFARRGGRTVLVVGEQTRIVAWVYRDGTASDPQVLVDGLPSSGHGAKGVAVQGDTVFYSLGSASNRDPSDRTSQPERASVWRVGLDGSSPALVATGVRNGFALAIAPDGTLFAAVNQADNQPYPFRDDTGRWGQVVDEFVNENPVDQVTRLVPGTELGWPYCLPDTRGSDDLTDLPFVEDPLTNADGRALDCSAIPPTMVGLPAHSAPLGLSFTAGTALEGVVGSGALITSHGSWNRTPPRPPSVALSAWDPATATLGAPVTLVTGFQDEGGARWGRSVAAVPGPDGSVYVTDDQAGLVYRITPG